MQRKAGATMNMYQYTDLLDEKSKRKYEEEENKTINSGVTTWQVNKTS